MEMEFMEEFDAAVSGDRARQIVRGKRTKRQRPCSPVGTAVAATSSNSSGGGGGRCAGNSTVGDGDCVVNYYAQEMSTEEEEDMANCLIMLAQSVCPVRSDHPRQKTDRLSSRRFTEVSAAAAAAAAGGGKSGFYVYECKTCNRTFPSFQALGGHRASHKKPKLNFEEKRSVSVNCPPPLTEYPDERQLKLVMEDQEEHKSSSMNINNHVQKSPSPSPGFIQSTVNNNNNNKGKVHECSICGSEFLSGQALGGHMRKHRTTPPSSNRIGTSTSINDDRISDHVTEKSPAGGGMLLSLDLNLPPPEVADDVQSKFQFTASTSQQHLVFSAPALIDCHY